MNKPDNLLLVIFGASGDLTWRKLVPALYALNQQNMLPENFAVLGVGRSQLSDDDFRDKMASGINKFREIEDAESVTDFAQSLNYIAINTSDSDDYKNLKNKVAELNEKQELGGNVIYYLATPPSLYQTIAKSLSANNMCCDGMQDGWRRLIVEKPFGYDVDSAKDLNRGLLSAFDESQIYRIDHYLGKETAQNILVTRFFNGIFEPLWNRNYIESVEITSAESVGVEKRGGYYDTSGAMRDMLQNHLLQLAALTAMESPAVFNADSIRNEVIKVFQSLRPLSKDDVHNNVIRGQYTESNIKGVKHNSYIDEEGVPKESRTETFVALKFFIDNWRWGGVPFYIRTGKKLPTRVTEIVIRFKETPHPVMSQLNQSEDVDSMLVIRIQPDEGLLLKVGMKVPGAGFKVQNANMNFRYSDLNEDYMPSAYERLLHDCMIGDASLFARGDAVEAAWEFVAPIQDEWANNPDCKLYGYPAGTWGPDSSDALIAEKHGWRYPCKNLINDGVYCEL